MSQVEDEIVTQIYTKIGHLMINYHRDPDTLGPNSLELYHLSKSLPTDHEVQPGIRECVFLAVVCKEYEKTLTAKN